MFSKILVPFDGSEHSLKAVDYAIKLGELDGSQIEVLYVSPPVEHYMWDSKELTDSLEKEALNKAEEVITTAKEKFNGTNVKYITAIKNGEDVAEVIIDEVEKSGTKIIVIGSRGLSAPMGLLLGSVSQKVVNHASCPVLIVK